MLQRKSSRRWVSDAAGKVNLTRQNSVVAAASPYVLATIYIFVVKIH